MSTPQEDDYPTDFDLTISSQDNQSEEIQNHLVGRPPESDIDCSEDENNFDDSFVTSGTGSGSEPFPIEDYNYTVVPPVTRPEPLPPMNNDLVVPDDAAAAGLTEFIGDPIDMVKIIFTSSLASFPLELKNGYDSEDLNRRVLDLIGFDLISIGQVLLGDDKMDQLANKSKTEVAHALVKDGWMKFENSKFYPVLPETELETIASLIEGSEKLAEREDRKKKEAEIYPNEESEVRALHTFNMIVELMNAVRETHRITKVPYQKLNQAFSDMVKGQMHEKIFNKYRNPLNLNSEMTWNSTWFNKYTNRSTMKKFVQMAKFSEIVVLEVPMSHFYFRADDDNNRPVVMFSDDDIREVREKWSSGNERNLNYGNNVGRGGQRSERNGSSYIQQPKKQIAEDPNYRSSTFAGGISSTYDDGSLEPSTSTRPRDNQPSTSNRAFRRSPSPSPVRQNTTTTVAETPFAQDHNSRSRSPSPEPTNRPPVLNPFAGMPVQRKIEEDRRQGNTGGQGGRYQPRPVARVQDYGETSSEGEITSEGSYSDEDEELKVKRKKRRDDKKKEKLEREMRRRERHAQHKPAAPVSQFTNYYKPMQQDQEPEEQTQEEAPASEQEDQPAATTAPSQTAPSQTTPVEQPPVEPTPAVPQSTNIAPSNDVTPPPPPVTSSIRELPLVMSSSLHDEERFNAQIPYRPAEGVMERNKAEKEEKKKREELSECRARSQAAQSGRPPVQNPLLKQSSNPRPAPSQAPSIDPFATNGFAGARNHAQPFGTVPSNGPPPQGTGGQMGEAYHGRNRQGPRASQQAPPPQQMQQQFQPQFQPQHPPQQQQMPQQQFQQQQAYQQQPQQGPPMQQQFPHPPQQQQQFAPQFAPQQQQFAQGPPQSFYPQQQQQQQFQQPMQQQQQQQPIYQDQYRQEPAMNQYLQHQMNAQRQPYAPSQGNPNQYCGNQGGNQYGPRHPPPSNDWRPPSGDQRRPPVPSTNFNRPHMQCNAPRPSSSITFQVAEPPASRYDLEKIKRFVMLVVEGFEIEGRTLYEKDLDQKARDSTVIPPGFNFAKFIYHEMKGILAVKTFEGKNWIHRS